MISIELDSHEAFLVLGPIQNAAADALIESATLRGEKSEYAEVRAKVLQRVASRIADELFPRCGWMDNEECCNPVERDGLCGRHLRHAAAVADIMARPVVQA